MTDMPRSRPFALARIDVQAPRQFLLAAFGFALYPIEIHDGVETCPAVAIPHAALYPHRPKLVVPEACIQTIEGDVPSERRDGAVFVDVAGLAASFRGAQAVPAQVVRSPDTSSTDIPVCDPLHLDLSLVPDFETLCSGVRLTAGWRESPALEFRFELPGGVIGGSPDEHTCEKVWVWGLRPEDERPRRLTGVTAHLSGPLDSLDIELTTLGGTRIATVVTTPHPGSGLVTAGLVNLPVGPDGAYVKGEEHAINLAHLHAMLALCEPVPGEQIKAVFGRRMDAPAAALPALGERFPAAAVPFAGVLQRLFPFYDGNPSCAARRMLVR